MFFLYFQSPSDGIKNTGNRLGSQVTFFCTVPSYGVFLSELRSKARQTLSQPKSELFFNLAHGTVIRGARDMAGAVRCAATAGGAEAGLSKGNSNDQHAVV